MVNGKTNPIFASVCMVLMMMVLHDVKAALQTTFMEDICYSKKSVIVDLRYQPLGSMSFPPQIMILSKVKVLSHQREFNFRSIFNWSVPPDC
ncbi:hypothetical protein HNY73_002327 [Argiope bruennichi]|uniref:Secreted protein n=1 Tax=Argiope bruennichi TaxID=94029 RepID=A0A8T0FU86_ARGBR|nr:hypothetical protein HNY73_002327 [Argiope bruennichi]